MCISLAGGGLHECNRMYGVTIGEEGWVRRWYLQMMHILDAHGRTTTGPVAVRAQTLVQSLRYAQHIR
jgi:hypothetical protein